MCGILLRVSIKGEKTPEYFEVESESAIEQKLKALQERINVAKVGVFKRAHDVVRTERWESVVYVPPKPVEVLPKPEKPDEAVVLVET